MGKCLVVCPSGALIERFQTIIQYLSLAQSLVPHWADSNREIFASKLETISAFMIIKIDKSIHRLIIKTLLVVAWKKSKIFVSKTSFKTSAESSIDENLYFAYKLS